MFHRSISAQTRALCHQRHTIAPAITTVTGRLPSTHSSAMNQRRDVSKSISTLNYSCREYSPGILKSSSPLASVNQTIIISPPSIIIQPAKHNIQQIRSFRTVGGYHDVADDTLNDIQDSVEDFLEDHYDAENAENEEDIPEVNFASGVLTLYLPPHGTWIINKQTPNQQLWWSSPISGPRRYEYEEESERWVYSRIVDEKKGDDGEVNYDEEDTLEGILNKELEELFPES
mmetsp:Transcript_52/g.100  ORF Transcript_52/g.100 Transcript_52/m.100 type:complete len:231 (-) Transcript_52:463-1155(-)|eukprot:CAMPEP_0201675802 /NCGR_PEP_ID=MMETSP0494-20130426/40390_1 /ASSEMBLY_ACC=CAM_ASM_000839 /TAXON_ID=420259 /ORGANISM="Thalassiosira gravida, Strain GMp14c1" /LENGTH=230 /DNA_ID=CAMNT_0048158349 /DNA_START=31 /DNA_END=723 /DNA_ORIENTATION=+